MLGDIYMKVRQKSCLKLENIFFSFFSPNLMYDIILCHLKHMN